MAENAIYELEIITDDPKFEGFAFVRKESLRGKGRFTFDFFSDNIKTEGRAWTITRMADIWTPQPVIGRVRPFNDYPCVNLLIPAFSRRAVDGLRDLLEANGELLPLASTVGEFYGYNITTVVDILDHDRSSIEWPDKRRVTAFEIMRYEFFIEKMAGLSIFRLVEMPTTTYVSQVFVDRVREHELQGFRFTKLWPLPNGVSWKEQARKAPKKKGRVPGKRDLKPVAGNTVVLLLPITRAKPNKAEKQRLAKLMDEIDALLYDSGAKPDDAYSGSLEGDDLVANELRLFLSCPDADVLIEKLRPWLKAISWQGTVKVLKRYGELADINCREEYVEL